MNLPPMDKLRAASLGLRIGAVVSAVPGMTAAVEGALALERYHLSAQAVGVSREHAAEILRTVQGPHAGSTPTTEELEEATRLLAGATR